MNLKLNKHTHSRSISTLSMIAFALALNGCGSSDHGAHEKGHPLFKGQVVKVEYRLIEGKTIIFDSGGKQIVLEGHPGIPCTNIEIFKHGHEYEIFQIAKQG